MRLKNKIILITGAGSGIGRATAILFSKEGAQLILNDVNKKDLNITFAALDGCLLYTSPSPRDLSTSRMPSSA